MCDIAVVPIFMGMVGIAMQGAGMSKQASADRARVRQAQENSKNARMAAVQVQEEAGYEGMRLQMRADQLVGNIRTIGAAGNNVLSTGSAARLPTDAYIMSAFDQEVIKMRGVQKAAGFILQGDTFSAQAAAQADQSYANQLLGWSSVVSSASKLGQDWWKWNEDRQPPPGSSVQWADLNAGPD
jgi:hypothetical protein